MKNLLKHFSVLALTFSIVNPTIACFYNNKGVFNYQNFSQTKTLLYDVTDKNYEIPDDREDNGSLLRLFYDRQFAQYKYEILKNHHVDYRDVDREVVASYINQVNKNNSYLANFDAIKSFEELSTKKHFNNLGEVESTMKSRMPNNKYNYDFDKMAKCAKSIDMYSVENSFKKQLLDTFNRLANVYGLDFFKHSLYQLLYDHDPCNCPYCQNINISEEQKKEASKQDDKVVAYVARGPIGKNLVQGMYLGPDSANHITIAKNYHAGWWSTHQLTSVITHEFGHVLENYLMLKPSDREKLNNNKVFENNQVPPIKDLVDRLEKAGPSKERFSTYSKLPSDYLVDFLADKLGVPKENSLQRQIAAWSIVQSNYGRYGIKDYGTNFELFAEAFAAWLLTPPYKRTLSWQALNEFFTSALPKAYDVKPNQNVS